MSFITSEPSMVNGLEGYSVKPILTIGETISDTTGAFNGLGGDYTPVGILDGMGGYMLDDDTVRMIVNHELSDDEGVIYTVNNGLDNAEPFELTGARLSYFDIEKNDMSIKDAGLAYNQIFDLSGALVRDTSQLDTDPTDDEGVGGLDRFCSATLFEPEEFGEGIGFEDRLYFGPQEVDNGVFWALDVDNGNLWAAPALGRGAWENLTTLDTGDPDTVAMVLGDDDFPANLLYLYIGEKNGFGDGSFLDRNGLKQGTLYAWTPDENLDGDVTNDLTPADISQPGQDVSGTFVELNNFDPSKAGEEGYDELGYALQDTLRAEAEAIGSTFFSRVEDVATNPDNSTEAAFTATGTPFNGITRDGIPELAEFVNQEVDTLGTLYTIDVDFSGDDPTGELKIIYRGDAEETNPANAILRSPDNLDWADNGYIYINEDEANIEFGDAADPQEASIVKIDPTLSQGEDGFATRVAQIDRSVVVPEGTTDNDAEDVGEWETSGVLDVSELFGADELYTFDVQAHTIEDGIIADQELVEGGQLSFLMPDAMLA